jgi:HlyD family secretion protein
MTLQNLDLDAQLAEVNQGIAEARAEVESQSSQLSTARIDRSETDKTLERNRSLWERGAISQADYEAALAADQKLVNSVTSLEAALEGSQSSLKALMDQQASLNQQEELLTVSSPIDATILALPTKKGQLVPAGTVLVTVGTAGRLEVTADILCDDILGIKPGEKAEVTFSGETLPGRVKEVSPQAFEKISALGVSQRLVPVVVTLDQNGSVKPGYEVQVAIETARRNSALLLPREAIVTGIGGDDSVRVVTSKRVEIRKVVTGLQNQLQIEILKGLNPGDLVIRDGSSSLENGSRVRIKN